ncbi:hypothetical protein D3C86_1336630 [compost metagenome]
MLPPPLLLSETISCVLPLLFTSTFGASVIIGVSVTIGFSVTGVTGFTSASGVWFASGITLTFTGSASTVPNQFPNPKDAKLKPAGKSEVKSPFCSSKRFPKDETSKLFSVAYFPTVLAVAPVTKFNNEFVDSVLIPA